MARNFHRSVAIAFLVLLVAIPAAGAKPHQGKSKRVDSAGLLALAGTCNAENDLGAPIQVQLDAMSCLVDSARRSVGLPSATPSRELERAADAKAADILRCNSFSHSACGRDFTYWMDRFGFLSGGCWRAAENIAWGTGRGASARNIFRALIHSPEHRRNILGEYTRVGIGVQVGRLDGRANVHVWTQHFGSHCETRRTRR